MKSELKKKNSLKIFIYLINKIRCLSVYVSVCPQRYRLENYRADFDEIWYADYRCTLYLHIDVIFFVERIRGVLPPKGVPKPTFTYKM